MRMDTCKNVSLASLSPLAGLNMDVLSVCRPSAIFDEPGLYGIAWIAFITAFLLKWSFKWKLILLSVLKHKSSSLVSGIYNVICFDSKSICTHLFSSHLPKSHGTDPDLTVINVSIAEDTNHKIQHVVEVRPPNRRRGIQQEHHVRLGDAIYMVMRKGLTFNMTNPSHAERLLYSSDLFIELNEASTHSMRLFNCSMISVGTYSKRERRKWKRNKKLLSETH